MLKDIRQIAGPSKTGRMTLDDFQCIPQGCPCLSAYCRSARFISISLSVAKCTRKHFNYICLFTFEFFENINSDAFF